MIHNFFLSKDFHARSKFSSQKLIFQGNLSGNSKAIEDYFKKKKINVDVVKMEDVYLKKVRENGLYSELIESFLKIGTNQDI